MHACIVQCTKDELTKIPTRGASKGSVLLESRFGRQSTVGTGKGVTIYTIDSGIRQSHQEFQAWSGGHGRASYGCAFISLSSLCHLLRILRLVGQQVRNMGVTAVPPTGLC
jgi:hypothetical protein